MCLKIMISYRIIIDNFFCGQINLEIKQLYLRIDYFHTSFFITHIYCIFALLWDSWEFLPEENSEFQKKKELSKKNIKDDEFLKSMKQDENGQWPIICALGIGDSNTCKGDSGKVIFTLFYLLMSRQSK